MSEQLKKALENKEEDTSVQEDAPEVENEDVDDAEASDDTSVEESEEESDDSSDVEESKDDIDYKSLLEVEIARREKAEKAIVKMKKSQKEEDIDNDWTTDEPKLSEDRIAELLEANNQKIISQLTGDYEIDVLDSITSNPDERELIKFHLENTIKRTGLSKADIKADALRAKAIANADRLTAENAELKNSAKARKSITNSGVGSAVRKTRKEDVDPQAAALIKKLRANKM